MPDAHICIILNPNAGSADQREALFSVISDRHQYCVRETREPGQSRPFAAEAAQEGFSMVVAAGGDGTIHEVANGLMDAGADCTMGIIPLGTGNDLARTLGIPADPRDAAALLTVGLQARLDLVRVTYESGEPIYCINVAAGGFAGTVGEQLTPEIKAAWGPLAYLIGAVNAVPTIENYRTTLQCDDGPEEIITALNIIVANARTAAGGKVVAPLADPQDGLMDVVAIRLGPVVEMAHVMARFVAGNYLDAPLVLHRRARKVRVVSTPGMWFNVDGELLTNEPVTFEVVPGALPVVVGSAYQSSIENVQAI